MIASENIISNSIKDNRYADIPIPDFVDIILNGDDEAMYYLLHNRLKPSLYERYYAYSQNLYEDYEDIAGDFFIYIRESGHIPYQALRRIKKKEVFECWLLNTFRNYLNNRQEAVYRVSCSIEKFESMSLLTEDSKANYEKMIKNVSQLIAYAMQVFHHHKRFIFLRSLLTILNKQQAVPNKEMAKALNMSYSSYRVTLYHIKNEIKQFKDCQLRGEPLQLDDMHEKFAKRICDDFSNLYQILFECYLQCIDTLKTSADVKELRRQYSENCNYIHEPDPSGPIRVHIIGFWEKLQLWLIG